MGVPLSIEEVGNRFVSQGYTVLGGLDQYKNAYSKLQVRCPAFHEYQTDASTFSKGHRCRICSPRSKSLPLLEVLALFKENSYNAWRLNQGWSKITIAVS